jgi:hypothetical protein
MVNVVVNFILDSAHTNYGKIEISVDTDFGILTEHFIAVEGPVGTVKSLPGIADVVAADATVLVDIPLLSNGNLMLGDYSIQVRVDEDGLGASIHDETQDFCVTAPVGHEQDLDLEILTDCYARKLVVSDNTDYPDDDTVTRTITIQHPTIAHTDDVADTVSSESEVTVSIVRSNGVAYENVSYGVTVVVQIQKDDVLTPSVMDAWTNRITWAPNPHTSQEPIVCNIDPCGIIACVDDTWQELAAKACKSAGISGLPAADKDKAFKISMNMSLYMYFLKCKNPTEASFYYDELKKLVNNCGCADPGTSPSPIGNSGIEYISGPSAYELWLAEGNTGSMSEFFDSLNPVGDWINIEAADFNTNFESSPTAPLRYRVLKSHIEFAGSFRKKPAAAIIATTPTQLLKDTFDPVDTTDDGLVPVFNETDFKTAGIFTPYNTSGEWRFGFNGDWDQTDYVKLNGLMPLDGIGTVSIVVLPGDWTDIEDSDLSSGYFVSPGQYLQYRVVDNIMHFRGVIDGVVWTTSGKELLPDTFFLSKGIRLEDDYTVPLFNDDNGGGGCVGHMRIHNTGSSEAVWVYFENGFGSDPVVFYGQVPIINV